MKIDFSDLIDNLDEDLRLTDEQVQDLTTKITFDVERDLKLATPVDTGRARGGWVSTAPSAPYQPGVVENNVEYIEALNNGHSQQAPANFIENVVERHNQGD